MEVKENGLDGTGSIQAAWHRHVYLLSIRPKTAVKPMDFHQPAMKRQVLIPKQRTPSCLIRNTPMAFLMQEAPMIEITPLNKQPDAPHLEDQLEALFTAVAKEAGGYVFDHPEQHSFNVVFGARQVTVSIKNLR
jgi:hypothetical protein